MLDVVVAVDIFTNIEKLGRMLCRNFSIFKYLG